MHLVLEDFKSSPDGHIVDFSFTEKGFDVTCTISPSSQAEKGVMYFSIPPSVKDKVELTIKGGSPKAQMIEGVEDLVGDLAVLKIWNEKDGDVTIACKFGKSNTLNGTPF